MRSFPTVQPVRTSRLSTKLILLIVGLSLVTVILFLPVTPLHLSLVLLGLLGGALGLIIPVRWLLVAAFLAVYLVDTRFIQPTLAARVLRFVPGGILLFRVIIDAAVGRIKFQSMCRPLFFSIGPIGIWGLLGAPLAPDKQEAMLLSVNLIIHMLVIAVVAWNYLNNDSEIESLLLLILVGAVFIWSVAIGSSVFVGNAFAPTGRFMGIFRNPNTVGSLGALLTPAVVWGYLQNRRGQSWWLLAVLGSMGMTLISGSRTGFIAASLSLLLWWWLAKYRQVRVKYTILVLAIGLMFIGLLAWGSNALILAVNRLTNIWTHDIEQEPRYVRWQFAWRLVLEKPLLGHGMAANETLIGPGALALYGVFFKSGVHNSYLAVAVDFGLTGLSLVLWAIGRSLWIGVKTVQARSDDLTTIYLLVTLAGLAVAATFETWLLQFGGELAFAFWLYAALLIKKYQLLSKARSRHLIPSIKK